jgi:hypothetical protein
MSGQRVCWPSPSCAESAACSLVLGLLACHDLLAPPPARYAPGFPFKLTLAGPLLILLGIVLPGRVVLGDEGSEGHDNRGLIVCWFGLAGYALGGACCG